MKNLTVFYHIVDVHYYLGGWKPLWTEERHQAHIIGGNFHPIPGVYPLPQNEGYWVLDGDANITFQPRGGG